MSSRLVAAVHLLLAGTCCCISGAWPCCCGGAGGACACTSGSKRKMLASSTEEALVWSSVCVCVCMWTVGEGAYRLTKATRPPSGSASVKFRVEPLISAPGSCSGSTKGCKTDVREREDPLHSCVFVPVLTDA